MDSDKRVVSGQYLGLDWTGLRPASKYDLRVYARNRLGKSDAGPVTTAETKEAGKTCFVLRI